MQALHLDVVIVQALHLEVVTDVKKRNIINNNLFDKFGPNMMSTWGQLGATLESTWANIGHLEPTWEQRGPAWANWAPTGGQLANLRPTLADWRPTWPRFPSRGQNWWEFSTKPVSSMVAHKTVPTLNIEPRFEVFLHF